MTTHLDVLLIERRPGTGTDTTEALESAGHRIHRCYSAPEDGHRASTSPAELCVGVTVGQCPLDQGVDVALLTRKGVAVRPSVTEHGVVCAIRAGVPVVEDGSDLFDPYGPWLSGRVRDDVVGACEEAAHGGFAALHAEIRRRIERSLAAAGIRIDEVDIRFETDGPHLTVVISGPPADRELRQALGVRVLDAVRTVRRTFAQIDVSYEPTTRPTPVA